MRDIVRCQYFKIVCSQIVLIPNLDRVSETLRQRFQEWLESCDEIGAGGKRGLVERAELKNQWADALPVLFESRREVPLKRIGVQEVFVDETRPAAVSGVLWPCRNRDVLWYLESEDEVLGRGVE